MWIADDGSAARSDALGGAVALLFARICPVQLYQHGVVHVAAEGVVHGFQVCLVAVRRELYPLCQALAEVV